MNKILFTLLFVSIVLISGCAREKPVTKPAPANSPPASSNISIGGGGPAETIAPSDPQEAFKNAVLNADLIVSGNITSQRYEVVTVAPPKPVGDNATGALGAYSANVTSGKFVYTIFTLTVEKVIKGGPATKEVLIKAPGGYTGDIYQGPTGWYFKISDQLLVGLHRESDNIYTVLHSGVFWLQGSATPRAPLQAALGNVVKSMLEQNIPVALPPDKRPDIPTGPVRISGKRTTSVLAIPTKLLPSQRKSPLAPLNALAAGWNNLMTENFEGNFPADNNWVL